MERINQKQQQKKWYTDIYSITLIINDIIAEPQPQDIQLQSQEKQKAPIEKFQEQLEEILSAFEKYEDYYCESSQEMISDIYILLQPTYSREQIQKEQDEIKRHLSYLTPKELKNKKFEQRIKRVYGLERVIKFRDSVENIVRVRLSYQVKSCDQGFQIDFKGPKALVQEIKTRLCEILNAEIKSQEECNFFQRKPYQNYDLNVRGFKKELEEFPNRGIFLFQVLEHNNKPLKIRRAPFDQCYSAILELYS